ncbi:hypothetical protein QQF64_003289, partial [Cirrhinus molitorella]
MDHLKKYVEPEPHIPKKWVSSPSHAPPSSTQRVKRVIPLPQIIRPTSPTCSKYLPIQCSATSEDKPLKTSSANTTPAPNPEEQENSVLWSKIGPYKLFTRNLMDLAPERMLKSEINESVEEMIAEECVSEGIKRQDRLYQIVQDNMAQVGDRVLSQQRKGGKLDPDFFGPYVVTKVDDKSIDIVDDNGKLFPRINIDHLVHFLEDRPPKAPKASLPITTTSFPATTFSVPNTTLPTIQPPALTLIYPVTLPVKLSLPNFPCPASSAASQPAASFAASQPAASSAVTCTDLLRDIWAGKVGGRLWSKIGPYKIFTWDLERLKPGEKLESEVINASLTCIASRYKGNVFVIDTFHMLNLWNGKATEMRKIDLKVYDLLMGSVNEEPLGDLCLACGDNYPDTPDLVDTW